MSKRNATFQMCPRCGEVGLEQFCTHSYCVNCNYSSEDWSFRSKDDSHWAIPNWAAKAVKMVKAVAQNNQDENEIPSTGFALA